MFAGCFKVNRVGNVEVARWARCALLVAVLVAGKGSRPVKGHEGHTGGQCIELPELSIMTAADAAPEAIDALAASLQSPLAFIPQGSRWTTTAVNGTVAAGDQITLTYSFVPDGTSIPGSGGEPTSPSQLFAVVGANFPGGVPAFKAAVADAFDQWGAISNITYVEVADDGAAFPISPGVVSARGDIRIAMHVIGGTVMAYNFFPQFGGDMVMDSEDIGSFANPANSFRALKNTLIHEHGHGLGLNHVEPQNATKVMEPVLNLAFDGPQEDDVRAIQFLYGDAFEPNNAAIEANFTGGPLRDPADGVQVIEVTGAALEDATAEDWFSFTAFAGTPIAIRVEPVGTTYAFGPQNGTATTVDAKAARNLGLELWRRVSAQDQTFQLLARIDFNESGVAEVHPPITYTVAGFMAVRVFSADGVNDVQRYNLTISNAAIEQDLGDPVLLVTEGLEIIPDGSTMLFGGTTVGQTSARALTIRNNGPAPLVFTGPVTVQGPGAADFVVQGPAGDIAPGSFGILGISFQPTAEGQRVAVVTMPNNDPAQSGFSFIVSGTAIAAQAAQLVVEVDGTAVNPDATIDLGAIEVGASASATLTVRNTGNAALTVSAVNLEGAAAGDWSTELQNATLSPGAVVSSQLSVTPTAAGTRDAALSILSNSQPTPFVVQLRATGTITVVVDCNGNGVEDADDIADGTSTDCNLDGVPDDCDTDTDGDGVIDLCDNCVLTFNADQIDFDADGVGNACDNCPLDANADQADADGDSVGDVCAPVVDPADPTPPNPVDEEDFNEDEVDVDVDVVDDEEIDEEVVDQDDEELIDEDDDFIDIDEFVDNFDDFIDDEDGFDDEFVNDDDEENARERDVRNRDAAGAGPCGVGVAALIPMMLMGLCGMRTPGRREDMCSRSK